MSENLLRNGDFEEDWSVDKSHRCLVIPFDDEPYERPVDNIFTPSGGWVTWFVHQSPKWDQPEVRDAWASADPYRVHAGLKGTLLFTFWRRHWAGFYQEVEVTPGAELSLSAYAHAWSNTNIPDHPYCTDNPRCSAGVGNSALAIPVSEAPPLTGDPWSDAVQNFVFRIGIDPTGGTHPLADTVIWSIPLHIYNEYHRLTAEAVAVADTATVFLSSITQYPFKHNDAYWDSAELTQKGEIEDVTRGEPREQYERTYVLLPPNANHIWAGAVVEATWDARRWTFGGSADDAAIGDLDVRRIVAVNPSVWGDLAAFYNEHYPGIEYIPIEATTPETLVEALRSLP